MTRYYGVFASRHHLRARLIPSSPQSPAPIQLSLCLVPALPEELREATMTPRRIGWANLLARVFAVDVTVCSKCGGRMKILEVVTDPGAIAELLHRARAPPRPRTAATLSSWTVVDVRLSPRRRVAVRFARPVVGVSSREHAAAVSWPTNASRGPAERWAHPVERPCAVSASASFSLRVPGSSPRFAVRTS